MAWKKGESGNPNGAGLGREKPFREALRMEIAQGDGKTLRRIAARLIAQAENGESAAIKEIADRLDGKPAQESTVTTIRRRAEDMTDDELTAIAAGSGESDTQSTEAPPLTH